MPFEIGVKELTSKKYLLWQSVFGEFLGNTILSFFGIGSLTQDEDGTFKALGLGLGIYIAITIIGHVSGGHINPAVTIAMLVVGRISFIRSVLYIIFQCLGSIAGTACVKLLLHSKYHNGLGHTELASGISPLQGFGIEFALGLILIFTVFGACDVNKPDSHYTAPLAIGLSVALGHFGSIGYTGSSMNPARSLGTAVVAGDWSDHWVFWAGPICGGIVASYMYTLILEVTEADRWGSPDD